MTSKPPLSEAASQKLARFALLIHEWNHRINLTGFRSVEQIREMLIDESLAALPWLNLANKTVLDFGSGAGIPGLVWAIAEPSVKITSLEIRQKKVAFQKEALRELDLQVEVIRGLFPEAVAGRMFDGVVSRAIRFSPALWEEARALVAPDGFIARFVAHRQEEAGWKSLPISPRSTLLICRT